VLGSLFYDRLRLIPKAEAEPSLPQEPKAPLGLTLPLDRPVLEFHYPARSSVKRPTDRVSIGQFNEFISLYRVPQAEISQLNQPPDRLRNLNASQAIR
jgi:hypothetical protein